MGEQQAIVSINLGDPGEERQLPLREVQRIIHDNRIAANFGLAASVATQLADQLPGNLWSQFVAAESLYLHQQVTPAFGYIDRALALETGHIASLVLKSRLCAYIGDQAQAAGLIDSALGLAPEDSRLHGIKAELLAGAGDVAGARDWFLKSIDLDRRNANALIGLSRLPGDNFGDELIEDVEAGLRSPQLPADARLKAHFALAHVYDGKGDVDRHFSHLNAGNDLKSRSLNYDPDEEAREASTIIDYFSKDLFERRQVASGNSANIVFIVGFPRCGSTLVEQILSSHPSVSAAGETYALKHSIVEFQQSRDLTPGYPSWIARQPDAAFGEIADIYLRTVQPFDRGACLTDKLLDNYKFIGAIHYIFPHATIIHVQRNPIDVCYSCYKRLFDFDSLPFAYSLEHLAGQYRSYRQVMRHWVRVLPGTVHTVEYERLVANQEEVTRALLGSCGLPWDDACMEFHRNARSVQTASNIQVRQPLYADSIDRWKLVEAHLGPLLALDND